MYSMQPTTTEDVFYLGDHLNEDVQKEVWASHGLLPMAATKHCFIKSICSYTGRKDDEILGIVGLVVGTMLGQWASPWLLTTDRAKDHPIFIVRESQRFLKEWLKAYPVLENYVDARYLESLKWAKAVGFTIHEAQPFGYLGLPFHRITVRRD